MSEDPIEGKVAAVLTERQLIINVGASKGVEVGMRFKVLAEPAEVTDPDTNKVLTTYQREKVRVQVTELYEEYSVCSTYRSWWVGGGYLAGLAAVGAVVDPGQRRRVVETLRTDKSEFIPSLSEEESYVKRGDRVIQIPAETE